MMDNWYDNIGNKLKTLAKCLFVVVAIFSIIIGILNLTNTDKNVALSGIFILVFGPFLAWISSWTLYAFGELVEKTSENASHSKKILAELKKSNTHSTTPIETLPLPTQEKETHTNHKWRCNNCGKMRSQNPCEFCGKQ